MQTTPEQTPTKKRLNRLDTLDFMDEDYVDVEPYNKKSFEESDKEEEGSHE